MSFSAEEADIKTRFSTAWGSTTTVSYPNEAFTEPTNEAWVRLSVLGGSAQQIDLGDSATFRNLGVIVIQVFVPTDSGVVEAMGHADTAAAIFRRASFSGITCRAPAVRRVGVDDSGTWYQVNVEIPFYRNEVL